MSRAKKRRVAASIARKNYNANVNAVKPSQQVLSAAKSSLMLKATEGQSNAYDEYLLERVRTQWQFGDWGSLAALSEETIGEHPERAQLALFVGAGCSQTGNSVKAQEFVRLAKVWGAGKNIISRILIAGVHNSLGRAAAIIGEQPRALQHFNSAIAIGSPGNDARLLARARISYQCQELKLPSTAIGTSLTAVQPADFSDTTFSMSF